MHYPRAASKDWKPSKFIQRKERSRNKYQAVTVDASSVRRKLHETSYNFLISLFFLSTTHFFNDRGYLIYANMLARER